MWIAVIVTTVCLLGFGIWYARLEYRRPIYPTYWAVVIGVGVSMAGQIVMATMFYLLDYGVPGIVAGILIPFALTGVPMAAWQEHKERRFVDDANNYDTGELRKPKDGDS